MPRYSEEEIKQAFAEGLDIPTNKVHDGMAYDDTPKWDSISHMVLIAALEQRFEILIDTDDVVDMSSFAKAKEILGKYGVEVS